MGGGGQEMLQLTPLEFVHNSCCINISFHNPHFLQFPVVGATFLFIGIVLAFFPISSKTHLNLICLFLIWGNNTAKNPPAEERLVVCVHRERTNCIHLALSSGMSKGKRLGLLYI